MSSSYNAILSVFVFLAFAASPVFAGGGESHGSGFYGSDYYGSYYGNHSYRNFTNQTWAIGLAAPAAAFKFSR